MSAILLKRKGYEVVGVFMKNWDTADEFGNCQADKDAEEAEGICKQLDIPFHLVSFVKEYWHEVFTDLITEYQNGFTPNPDIQCNRHLKFGHFHTYCMQVLGCDAVATGHYARTSYGEDLEYRPLDDQYGSEFYGHRRVKLMKAIDRIKDQTFFLSQVKQEPLRNSMFPIGNFTKDVVKKIAHSSGFEKISQKRESMGICFIGKRKSGFAGFIQDYIPPNPGALVDIDSGKVVGEHQGVHLFTLGQRVIGFGGQNMKMYVADKDVNNKTVLVCFGRDHPALYSETFFTGPPHWIDSAPQELTDRQSDRSLECEYRSQNTHPLCGCVITHSMTSSNSEVGASNFEFLDKATLTVSLVEPQRATTPGQFAVFYQGDECLGSARINRIGPTLYAMNKNNCRDIARKTRSESILNSTGDHD